MRDRDVLKVMIAYAKEHSTWLIDEFKRQFSFLLNYIWPQASILPLDLISLLLIFYHVCNGTRSWGLTIITQTHFGNTLYETKQTVPKAAASIVIVQKLWSICSHGCGNMLSSKKKMLGQLRETLPVCKNQLINAAFMAYNN